MITIFDMHGLICMTLLRDRFPFPLRFPSSIFTLFACFHRFRRHVLHGPMGLFVLVALFVLLHVGCHRCWVGSEWKGRFPGWVVVGGMRNLWSWCVGGFFVAGGDPSYVVKNDSGRDTGQRSPRATSVWGGWNDGASHLWVRSTTPSFVHTYEVVGPLKHAMHGRNKRRRRCRRHP